MWESNKLFLATALLTFESWICIIEEKANWQYQGKLRTQTSQIDLEWTCLTQVPIALQQDTMVYKAMQLIASFSTV